MSSLSIFMTGAAGGVGRVLARELLEAGHRLMVTDRDLKQLKSFYAEAAEAFGDALSLQRMDVTSYSSWKKALESFAKKSGSLDVVLNIAGLLKPGYSYAVDGAAIDMHMDVNAKGTMYGIAVASSIMKDQGHGHIISISSLAGVAPIPGISLYSASKFAVRGYSLAVAQEMAEHNVQLTVLCPDAIRTPMLDLQKDYEEAALTFSGSRFLTPDDVSTEIQNLIVQGQQGKAPVEKTLPGSRGLLAKIASFAPATNMRIAGMLRKKGLKKQRQYRPEG
ncbi:MAG: 3-ketoacyl-ACP reductase [Spirochaetaceae bacterium]|nr:3-ketoacyl-ACP reductase [Spirochaetaceae bacterium]|tara:strand:- start:9082 stop:9915 length:834 start_codon:yes stop_codon:yes gene_type:complete